MSNFSLNNETVRRYLVRALTGDTERPRPPITLAGQRPDSAPQPIPPPAPLPPPIWTRPSHDRRWDRSTVSGSAEPEPGDEQWTYSRQQLVMMDNRFRARLLRAFKRGKESRQAAANQVAAPRW
jgi:hypothetical protein